ncbi:MAG: hypothetical protein ABIQ95_07405 [Bdellovibrionia bacterium]
MKIYTKISLLCLSLSMSYGPSVLAQEIDLVQHFGKSILAVTGTHRAYSREHRREFQRNDSVYVNREAEENCKLAGFTKMKEFSTVSSNSPEIWILKKTENGEVVCEGKSNSGKCTVGKRPSNYRVAYYSENEEGSILNIMATPLIFMETATMSAAFSPLVLAAPITIPVCSLLGLAAGVATLPVKLVGYTCEKISDYWSGAYSPVETLVFDRLICE